MHYTPLLAFLPRWSRDASLHLVQHTLKHHQWDTRCSHKLLLVDTHLLMPASKQAMVTPLVISEQIPSPCSCTHAWCIAMVTCTISCMREHQSILQLVASLLVVCPVVDKVDVPCTAWALMAQLSAWGWLIRWNHMYMCHGSMQPACQREIRPLQGNISMQYSDSTH